MSATSVPAVSVLHSPRDEALGEKIAGALLREGHKTRCLGEDPLYGDLLLEDGAAIVIWSKATAKLARLHEQAREAYERGALIPVTIGGGHAPHGFEALPAVDLSGWAGDDQDPRWRFIIDELNLAVQRSRTEDGAVWQEAEAAESADEGLAPVCGAGPDSEAENAAVFTQEAFANDAPTDDPVNVEASYRVSVGRYWPEAPSTPRKPFRMGAIPVVIAGGLGLIAASALAIMLAPAILSPSSPDQLAVNDPGTSRDSVGSAAFVQPITPVEDDKGEVKTQSDFVVTSFRDGAEPGDAQDETTPVDMPTDEPASATDGQTAEVVEQTPTITDDIAAGDAAVLDPASDEPPLPSSDDMENLVAEVTMDDVAAEEVVSDNLSGQNTSGQSPLGNYFTDCAACPNMASLPAGSFRLGSPMNEITRQQTEGPVVDISLGRPFAIATHEVTYDEWDACFADGGCRAYKPSDLGWGRNNRPVTNVSYEDAQSYIAWLSAKTGKTYRLPSEAEWEFAARGGTNTAFGLGVDVSPNAANYNGNYPFLGDAGEFRGRTTPVASFAPNNFGLYDMHGNLWEWTADCWSDSHAGAPADGAPVTLSACGSHVLKGGAWNTGGWRLRSAHRINKTAAARENDIGFRVARDLD